MTQSFIFIYIRNGTVKALPNTSPKLNPSQHIPHEKLIAEGWAHKVTLETCVWVEYLLNMNDADDILNEIYSINGIIAK